MGTYNQRFTLKIALKSLSLILFSMGYYSGKQIRQMIESGRINIEPDPQIGTASLDIGLGRIWESYGIPALRLGDEPKDLRDFFERYLNELGFMEGHETIERSCVYPSFSTEVVSIPHDFIKIITSRSSTARQFLMVQGYNELNNRSRHETFQGNIPMYINVMSNPVNIYRNERYTQLFLMDWHTEPLAGEDLVAVLKGGEVRVTREGRELKPDECINKTGDGLNITFDESIKILDSDEEFDTRADCSHFFREGKILDDTPRYVRSSHNFLASTAERIELSENYIGMLDFSNGSGTVIHSNAPYQLPGSRNKMTLECTGVITNKIFRGSPAGLIRIFPMNEPAEPYDGRYKIQDGAETSKAHLGL
jgi:deoxycytidine triphosphate deaminase